MNAQNSNEINEQSHEQDQVGPEENRWVSRFEELLKVKNLEDLKGELQKIKDEVQSEIQRFDLNAHLSPSAKARLKRLEQRYSEVMKLVSKAQKQFDREFNKSLRVLKKTRQDAEKQMRDIRTRISKHRGTILKASQSLTARLQGKKSGTGTIKKVKRAKKA
jgi:ElaB/YqjD/DUF883 family membrane-anchored ribosome-binding protein